MRTDLNTTNLLNSNCNWIALFNPLQKYYFWFNQLPQKSIKSLITCLLKILQMQKMQCWFQFTILSSQNCEICKHFTNLLKSLIELQKSYFWLNKLPKNPHVFWVGGWITPFELLTYNPQFTFDFVGLQTFLWPCPVWFVTSNY